MAKLNCKLARLTICFFGTIELNNASLAAELIPVFFAACAISFCNFSNCAFKSIIKNIIKTRKKNLINKSKYFSPETLSQIFKRSLFVKLKVSLGSHRGFQIDSRVVEFMFTRVISLFVLI